MRFPFQSLHIIIRPWLKESLILSTPKKFFGYANSTEYPSSNLSFLVFSPTSKTNMSSEQRSREDLVRLKFKGHCACIKGPFYSSQEEEWSHVQEKPHLRWEPDEYQEWHRRLEKSKSDYRLHLWTKTYHAFVKVRLQARGDI